MTQPLPARIAIAGRESLGKIDRNVYGHFLEGNFFGNIQGGVFDEGSPLALPGPGAQQGLRADVIAACRQLDMPVVRWPGGNYASAYHWEDGVGPRDVRPRRLELTWGGQDGTPLEEDNRFGTDEFLAWCAAVGAAPYLNTNGRGVEEAVRWLEYANYSGDSYEARRRAANGHSAPYDVRYWGIGNEVYGRWQMGHRPVQQYAADAAEQARFMRVVDPTIKLVGVGWRTEEWTRPLLQAAGSQLNYVSIHLYGASRHLFTAPDDDEYETTVAQPLYFEAELRAYADLVVAEAARAGLAHPPALALDEWNIRHLEPLHWPFPRPDADGGVAARELPPTYPASVRGYRVNRWSPRTAADALFYAGVFHAIHRLCGHAAPVAMANTVNLINANGLLAVRSGGLVKSATYYVWELYGRHMGPIAVPVAVEGPARTGAVRWGPHQDATGAFPARSAQIPYLDAVATRVEAGGSLRLAVINRHRSASIRAQLLLDGAAPPAVIRTRELGADVANLLAYNTVSEPGRVITRYHDAVTLADGCYTFPPHSITLLDLGGGGG